MAAVLAGGPGTVLSYRFAGALWAMRDTRRERIEITIPRGRRNRPGLDAHRIDLPADEITVERGIPVTTPARTLLDLATVLTPHQLKRTAERAESLRLTSPTSLQALLTRYPRRPGTPALAALIANDDITDTATRSRLERRFLTLLDTYGLPRPLVNARRDGREPDFTWREQRLIVEVDGYETHSTRDAFERDRARDRTLHTHGWRVVRITWRQLDDEPAQIAADLRTLLDRRRAP